MTTKKSRRRGVVLSLQGQRKLESARRQFEKALNDCDRFTLEELSERTQLALSTVTRVLDAQIGVDKQTLDQFFAAFDLLLERTDYQHPGKPESPPAPEPTPQTDSKAQQPPDANLGIIDWGEATDISTFYGRASELSILEQWIQQDHCRLIAIMGMGGIGKTALSVKLTQHFTQTSLTAPPFQFIIWRTLRNAPPLDLLLTDLIQTLSAQRENTTALPLPTLLSRLMHYLRQHRCLLILDNCESILQGGQFTGAYRQGYESYSELLRQVGEIPHQSCMILTSREKPGTLAELEGETLPVRAFSLSGLPPVDTDHLFNAIGLSSSHAGRQRLMEVYSGNPLALKIVATSIRELFEGDIDTFLGEETTIFNGIRRLLDQQYQRLTPLEKQVMIWLTLNREWVTIAELQTDIVPQVPKQRLLETLESLTRRSLIERKRARFTQQPVVMEYMTDLFIEQVCEELENIRTDLDTSPSEASVFNTYALTKTTVKEYIRESQVRLILKPIAQRLCERFSSIATLEQQILRILTMIRRSETKGSSYGAGNLVNLMHHLNLDLTGYNFSHLTLRQAYLQNTPLHRVNLAYAHLIDCRFAEPVPHPNSLAVSPDGDRIATGGEDGMIQMWQVSTGTPLLTLQAHSTYVFALTFSPDGQTLVSGSMDSGIKFWEASTGRCQQTWQYDRPWALAFSPDGQILAGSLGDADRSIHLWDWRTGTCLKTLKGHTGPASGLAFTPPPPAAAGEPRPPLRLVSGGQDCLVKIWDVESGECCHTLTEHRGMVWSVAMHPQGDRFATGSFDHTVKIWDLNTGTCLQTLRSHTAEVSHVSFSPDGQLLASASSDRTLRLWEVATGECLSVLQGHSDAVWSVAFTAGYTPHGDWAAGQALVSLGLDQTVRFWDVSRLPATTATAVDPDPETEEVLPYPLGQCTKTIQGRSAGLRSIAQHPHQPWIATGGLEGIVRLWDLSGNCFKTFAGHSASIWKVAFHPQHNQMASASLNGEVRIWDVTTGDCLHSLWANNSWIQAFGFSPQGHLLSASSSDATIRFWDSQTGNCWRSIVLDPDAYLLGMDFHPQGHYFVTAGNDSQLRWWDMETGTCFRTRSGQEGHTWSIAFHPQGHLFASIGNDSKVKLWEADTGECLEILQGHTGIHGSIAFSPDGSILASGRSDRTIRLWDVATRQCLKVLEGHSGVITSVRFIPVESSHPTSPGYLLASGSLDETLRLWDVNTGDCLQVLRPNRLYEGMNIQGVTGLTEGAIATLISLGAIV